MFRCQPSSHGTADREPICQRRRPGEYTNQMQRPNRTPHGPGGRLHAHRHPHRIRGLPVGQVLGELQHRHHRQLRRELPGRPHAPYAALSHQAPSSSRAQITSDPFRNALWATRAVSDGPCGHGHGFIDMTTRFCGQEQGTASRPQKRSLTLPGSAVLSARSLLMPNGSWFQPAVRVSAAEDQIFTPHEPEAQIDPFGDGMGPLYEPAHVRHRTRLVRRPAASRARAPV